MIKRLQIDVTGIVQGVGFRPTVYRHAVALALAGSVSNGNNGVTIEAEGDETQLQTFLERLRQQPPPHARMDTFVVSVIPCAGGSGFTITPSRRSGDLATGMPPDLATCDDCRRELFDPHDRRYRHPFINCTNCGPRFTIIRALPYDRERTSMAPFRMCPECDHEYHTPLDRRFDAQPDACPRCGPRLRLVAGNADPCPPDALPAAEQENGCPDRQGGSSGDPDPLSETVRRLLAGEIAAVKGIGGFHLCCLATADAPVRKLRERKRRPHKPLAVMFRDHEELHRHCLVTPEEEGALLSPARPIVVLRRRPESTLSLLISPDTGDVGAILPYAPLHHLLLGSVSPLVMTSANRAEEPIASRLDELKGLLGPVADFALDHDRPILRRCDDSVLLFAAGRPVFLRRSRGYVPRPLPLPAAGPAILACGAEVKNSFCVTRGRQAFMSQHVGDLTDYPAYAFFQEAVADLIRLLEVEPAVVAFDLHPDYLATRFARQTAMARKVPVQHHHAHIAACLAEHGVTGPAIGVALDGTGYGTDGTLWGGEFLLADLAGFRRAAHFKAYALPGGDEAVRHPARMAYSCLLSEFGPEAGERLAAAFLPSLDGNARRLLRQMIGQHIHAPLTSSAGRLFDAVAALLGCGEAVTYEGQAAIRLQALAERSPDEAAPYSFAVEPGTDAVVPALLSFGPALAEIVRDRQAGVDASRIAARFHLTLAAAVAAVCARLRDKEGLDRVALSGGVFQNALLLRLVTELLTRAGFQVLVHRDLPPNDGCIAFGQAVVALAQGAGRT